MLEESTATAFVDQTLAGISRQFPYHLIHLIDDGDEAQLPRDLTPAFCGCFDWHSAVHGHWLLARLLRLFPQAAFATKADAALNKSLTADKLAAELAFLERRPGFEMPYGIAWLLTLGAELADLPLPAARGWQRSLEPLLELTRERFIDWLDRLPHPIRTGEHNQSAFAMGLLHDVARRRGDDELTRVIEERARAFHGDDFAAPLHLEPSGTDFLSPSLATADLMARVLDREEFLAWFHRFIPDAVTDLPRYVAPASVADSSDGKLVHADGLNVSRAWMLEGIAQALPDDPATQQALAGCASAHRVRGLERAISGDYAGSHWLGTFAVVILTGAHLEHRA